MFKNFEDIKVGDVRTISKVITEADVKKFVEMTGDNNLSTLTKPTPRPLLLRISLFTGCWAPLLSPR